MLGIEQGKVHWTGMPRVRFSAIAVAVGLSAGLSLSAPVRADDAATMFGADRAVASEELAEVRGMDNVFEGTLTATLEDNTATGDSGSRQNIVDVNAFNGASGVATIVQNAGDNVIIQTITMVTVNYN